jgi:hypothetical protein
MEGSRATLICGLRILGLMFAVDLAIPFCTSYGLQTKITQPILGTYSKNGV